jgi:hypothetical protein
MPTNNQKWRSTDGAYEPAKAVALEAAYPLDDESTTEKLFDITCVVGSVYRGGTDDPRVVAFQLIGAHQADGTFTFPDSVGGMIQVTVHTTPVKPDGRS